MRSISKLNPIVSFFETVQHFSQVNAFDRRVDRGVLRKHGLLLLRLKERVLMRVLASSEDIKTWLKQPTPATTLRHAAGGAGGNKTQQHQQQQHWLQL